MSKYSKVGLAIDEMDYKLFKPLADDISTKYEFKEVKTPDNTYCVFYWDCIVWEGAKVEKLLKTLESHRHSLVEIPEDGNIWPDISTEDAWGCDEEFRDILKWDANVFLEDDPLGASPRTIKLPLGNDRFIVAEIEDEITISIQKNGIRERDLAFVGPNMDNPRIVSVRVYTDKDGSNIRPSNVYNDKDYYYAEYRITERRK